MILVTMISNNDSSNVGDNNNNDNDINDIYK